MRKTIALVLVAAMMLMFIPMAFAASSLSAVQNSYTYYDEDGIVPEKGVTVEGTTLKGASVSKGGIAYISRPYDDFVNWQVPGNALTGNVATWNKWINVKVVVNVEDAVNGTAVYIEGAKYVTDASGNFIYEFYCLPQAGGNTVSRTLALYDGSNKLMGYVTVSMVYSDVYKPSGYATTEGINQANTYATIDSDGVINVDVVYSNLVARMEKTSASNALYSTISYYPIRVRTVMTDKDGNLYPAFTRVDVNRTSASDLIVTLNEEVPNMTNWFYMTEASEIVLEKRLGAKGTVRTTLEAYVKYARLYGGFDTNGLSTYSWVNEIVGAARTASTGYGRLNNESILNQPFDALKFNSWTTDHVTPTSNYSQEDAIRRVIDIAIQEYYTDTNNATLFGEYAFVSDPSIYTILGVTLNSQHRAANITTDLESLKTLAGIINDVYTRATGNVMFSSSNAADTTAVAGVYPYPGLVAVGGTDITTLDSDAKWYAALNGAVTTFRNNSSLIGVLGSDYAISKLALLVDLVVNTQQFFFTEYKAPEYLIEAAVKETKDAYRDEITALLQNQLQYNANLYGKTTDEAELTLTKPNGEVSKIDIEIKYNAVSRIVAKALTTLDASQKTITIVKGESVDVTVKAYQDQIPVTGQPIKFTSNDTNIATATSPNVQSTSNSNTTTITGVNVGTTTVRAYVQSNAYTSNAMGTKVEAETYITVNVVDPTAETPAPTAPETTDFVCKVRKLWIRDGAGTSNSKLGYFSRNDIAKVIEVVNGWAKIEFNGGVAYASTGDGKYLSPK